MMKIISIKLIGTSGLLQSCDRLADPLDPATIEHKKLTAIRGKAKTFDIIREIAKSQYINSVSACRCFYEDTKGAP